MLYNPYILRYVFSVETGIIFKCYICRQKENMYCENNEA